MTVIYEGEDVLTQDQYDIQRRRLTMLEGWAAQVSAKKARRCDTCCWYREKYQDPAARDRRGEIINLPQGTCHAGLPVATANINGSDARWPSIKASEACRHWSQDELAPPEIDGRVIQPTDEAPRRAIDL